MVQNRKLALSISDASFGELLRQLEYQSEAAGGLVVKGGLFLASSKTGADWGQVNRDLTLSDRKWAGAGCGTIHNRDESSDRNAGKNIEWEALRMAGSKRSDRAIPPGRGYLRRNRPWTGCIGLTEDPGKPGLFWVKRVSMSTFGYLKDSRLAIIRAMIAHLFYL